MPFDKATNGQSVCMTRIQFSSVQDGIHAIGKAHMLSTTSLWSFASVAFETVSMTMSLSFTSSQGRSLRAFSFYACLLQVPTVSVSSSSTFQIFHQPPMINALPASLFALSFPLTPACPGQYTHRILGGWMSNIDTC